MDTFRTLFPQLNSDIHEGLERSQYIYPSPIQRTSIKPGLEGENIIAQAKSGSGKTVAFALTALGRVELDFTHDVHEWGLKAIKICPEVIKTVPQRLQCLIIAPTREVSLQICKELCKLAVKLITEKEFRIVGLVGGVPINADLLALRVRQPHIVVATPGRLLSLVQDESSESQKKVTRKKISRMKIDQWRWTIPPLKMVIFDEADKLLCENFQHQILALVPHLQSKPGHKIQSLFYSATYPAHLLSLTENLVYTLSAESKEENTNGANKDQIDENIAMDDDQLHIVVHGVSAEPNPNLSKLKILRKCFLVSSYIPHGEQDLNNGTVVARIPRRMEELSNAEEVVQMAQVVLDAPSLANVPCEYIGVDEDTPLETLIHQCCNTFELREDRIEGVVRRNVQECLRALLEWILNDAEAAENMSHWPDLLPKFILLICLLWSQRWERFLIFCNDSFSGEAICDLLTLLGLNSAYVSGRISQEIRTRYLRDLSTGDLVGLVCTDVLSRGIDIPEVNLVISVDLPEDKDTILHRIGRAGRFEREGRCYWLVRVQDEVHTLKLFSVQTGFRLKETLLWRGPTEQRNPPQSEESTHMSPSSSCENQPKVHHLVQNPIELGASFEPIEAHSPD